MRENEDQNNSVYGHFFGSAYVRLSLAIKNSFGGQSMTFYRAGNKAPRVPPIYIFSRLFLSL